MTVQEARQFFMGTEFSSETKEKISDILSDKKVLDPFTIIEIKAAMHEELARDMHDMGIDVSDDPEVRTLDAEYKANLEAIDAEMKEDLAFVDTELAELDKLRKKVMEESDKADADAIKDSLK